MAKALLELSLYDIVPPSIAGDPQVKAMMTAIDPELQSVSRDIGETLIISRIDELPEEVIDLLAWQWHVDFYELARTLEMKRAAVKESIAWHRKKGTVWAIEKALEMLGIKGTVIEWWKIPGAAPYTFAVEAEITDNYWTLFPGSKDAASAARHAVISSKSTRSGLIYLTVTIRQDLDLQLYLGMATMRGGKHRIDLDRPTYDPAVIHTGVATMRSGGVSVGLARPERYDTPLYHGIATVQICFTTILPAPGER